MNKGRRHELKMLKYKKRIKRIPKWLSEESSHNLYALRSHGKPCSCSLCRNEKFSRKEKHKLEHSSAVEPSPDT